MARFVALLRGINVGGNNLVPMRALRDCFEAQGYGNVTTYIQSGNVLFDATGPAKQIREDVERSIEQAFSLPISVVLRSHKQLAAIVAERPKGFGAKPAEYRYDVAFVREPLSAKKAIEQLPVKEGVDRFWPGTGVIYLQRLVAKLTSSRLNRIASLPVYKQVTIRNWNTTTKLLALLEARDGVR